MASVAALAVFAAAVRHHAKWEDRRTSAEWTSTVVGESLHASTHRDRPARFWQRPEDPADPSISLPAVTKSGPAWPLTEQERDDLDVYGPPVGLFGLLNRTSTPLGARRLRDILDSPCLSGEHISRRQQAVRWLGTHDEYRLGLMASLVPLRGHAEKLDTMVRLLHATPHPPQSIVLAAVRLWSGISGLIFVYAVLRVAAGQCAWGRALMVLLLVNFLMLLLLRPALRRLTTSVTPWTVLPSVLNHFRAAAQYADTGLPDALPLGLWKGHLHKVVSDARIPSLCAWLEWAGLQGMARGLPNIVVFIDLHVAVGMLSRIAPNRDVLLHGLSAMAELEALCSLACFSAEQPVACYPQPVDGTSFSIQKGRHPLLPEQDVAPNSVHLAPDGRTWVITGPNAAGKSTFLRMVGINVWLAQTGAAVAAREMTWSPVRLITDVRIRNDLARNESYFLSEVRRLRRLVLDQDSHVPILGLIDEPFRGTNSQERIAAGIALHFVLSRRIAKRAGLPRRMWIVTSLCYLVGMTLGAKLLFDLRSGQVSIGALFQLQRWLSGGLWGGLLVYFALAVPVAILLFRPRAAALNLAATTIPIPWMVAKLGCLLNGCCHGRPCSLPWAITFPEGARTAPPGVPIHPTQLYEIGIMLIILLVFTRLKSDRWRGTKLLWFLVLYGFSRAATDFLRGDTEQYLLAGVLSLTQWLCIMAAVAALLVLASWPRTPSRPIGLDKVKGCEE